MQETELREPTHCDSVLLIHPRKLQPELALRQCRRRLAAGEKQPQRLASLEAEAVNEALQASQLFQNPARQETQGLRRAVGGAHVRRNASKAAVASSSEAITSQ